MNKILILAILIGTSITSGISQSVDSTIQENSSDSDCIRKLKKSNPDKFTGDFHYSFSVHNRSKGSEVKVYRNFHKRDSSVSYILNIEKRTESNIYAGKGVTLLLENGEILEFPDAEVDYFMLGSGQGLSFYSRCWIHLTPLQIEKLKSSGISSFRLYIVDGNITRKADNFLQLFNCITSIK